MTLHLTGHVALPEHKAKGGFDHAAVHAASGHVYVAHTANDAVDVFDPVSRRASLSIPDLPGVAGALVSDEGGLVFSSNRASQHDRRVRARDRTRRFGSSTSAADPMASPTIQRRQIVLAANVGDPAVPGSTRCR